MQNSDSIKNRLSNLIEMDWNAQQIPVMAKDIKNLIYSYKSAEPANPQNSLAPQTTRRSKSIRNSK
jgi:hypothetical protein